MQIFVSYRRDDSKAETGRLCDGLRAVFGEQAVFHDILSIRLGEDFTDVIRREIATADVVLVVIGKNWLDGLDDPDDFVRFEVAEALRQNKRVVPLLLSKSRVPLTSQVPVEIKSLVSRQAAHLRNDPDFHHDLSRLIRSLGEAPAVRTAEEPDVEPALSKQDSKTRRSWTRAAVIGGGIAFLALALVYLYSVTRPESQAAPQACPNGYHVPLSPDQLTVCDKGPRVTSLQKQLESLGYTDVEADGHFGLKTLSAVENFQATHGLVAVGQVTQETLDKLSLAVAETGSSTTV